VGLGFNKLLKLLPSHTSRTEEPAKQTTIQQSFHNPDQALKGSLGRSPGQQRKFFMQRLTKKNEVAPGAQNNAVAVANDFVQSKRANRFLNVSNDLCTKENPSGNLKMRSKAEQKATEALAVEYSMDRKLTSGVLNILRKRQDTLLKSGLRPDVTINFNEPPRQPHTVSAQGPTGMPATELTGQQIGTLRQLYKNHLSELTYGDDAMREAKIEFKQQFSGVSDRAIKKKLKEISTENGAQPKISPPDLAESNTDEVGYDFFGRVSLKTYDQVRKDAKENASVDRARIPDE
jgi:hypothetical protein